MDSGVLTGPASPTLAAAGDRPDGRLGVAAGAAEDPWEVPGVRMRTAIAGTAHRAPLIGHQAQVKVIVALTNTSGRKMSSATRSSTSTATLFSVK